MSLIECRDLTLAYENRTVIENLSFTVESGDFLCIIGENGSGKTTLLSTLLGLHKQQKGKVLFGEGLKARQIGYLPQQKESQRDFPASVYEVALSGCLNSIGFRPFFGKAAKERTLKALSDLGIANLADRCYRDLSGGQQQRVLLARALCATQKLLILDEPTTGLDPIAAKEMYAILKRLNESGIAIVMVSHDIREAVSLSKHILHLHRDSVFFGDTCCYLECDSCKKLLAREDEKAEKEGKES